MTRMKYRSRTDIIALILRACMQGSTKTRIMYKAYLSYGQLKEYLAVLERVKLVTYDQESNVYRLMPSGLRFLNVYEELTQLMGVNEKVEIPGIESTYPSNFG